MRDALGAVQSAFVLGGTSEIALATVRRLIDQRCRTVVLGVRDPDAAQPLLDELRRLDVAGHAAVVDDVYARHGDVDLALIAFGVLGDQATFDEDPVAAAEAAQANYVGAVSSGLALANAIRRQGHGTIVVLSSVAGVRARASNFVYGSTKAGLDAFAQGLGDHLLGSGGRVMVVRPGFVHTRMTAGMPAQPFATDPDTVAAAITTGLEKGSEVVWAPGILRFVFAFMRVLPRPIWRIVAAR